MYVFESDGSRLSPVEADYVVVHTGERYDVYVEMNQPVDNYWLRVEFVSYHVSGNVVYAKFSYMDPPLFQRVMSVSS